jgi:hypothetical protein
MTGRHSGVVTCVQAVTPNATWVHCSIHREVKGMPDSLKDVLDTTVKMVKARHLKSHVFCALCSDMSRNHVTLLQVCWLSRGKVLTHSCFKLRDELKVFLTDHHFHLSDRLHDDEFLTRLPWVMFFPA